MNKADKAESLFRTGYNCSQSVYAAFAEELGITVEEAAKKASPFGAGFGKLREVCGAVTGMVMVIGDLYGYDDPKDAAVFILFCFEFYKLFLRIICVEHRFSKVGLSTINISQSVSASISIVDAVCP